MGSGPLPILPRCKSAQGAGLRAQGTPVKDSSRGSVLSFQAFHPVEGFSHLPCALRLLPCAPLGLAPRFLPPYPGFPNPGRFVLPKNRPPVTAPPGLHPERNAKGDR